MSAEIAVATLSGRTYFLLVTELKRRHLPFISLKPADPLPVNVKVVLTSYGEERFFTHKNILAYKNTDEPSEIIDKALMILLKKNLFKELIVGIDPGKTVGVALLGDGIILRTESRSSVDETLDDILKFFTRFKADSRVVRIGKGVTEYHRRFIKKIEDVGLPDFVLELVDEEGTTRISKNRLRKIPLDEEAAIRIAEKKGRIIGG